MEKAWFKEEVAKRGHGAQAALAKFLGMSASTLNKRIRTKRKISSDEADKIREWLELNPPVDEGGDSRATHSPGVAHRAMQQQLDENRPWRQRAARGTTEPIFIAAPNFERFAHEIQRRAAKLKKSPAALAQESGVRLELVEQIFRDEECEVTIDAVERLARTLASGVGDLIGGRSGAPALDSDGKIIRLYEVHTSAQSGPGGAADIEINRERSVGEYTFPAAGFRQRFGSAPDGVFIDEVGGDSNEPTLVAGQLIMVDSRIRRPYPPGFFLCWDGNGMVLKKLSVVPRSNPPRVQLISDNKTYPTYELLLSEVEIYGRVIGTWKKM